MMKTSALVGVFCSTTLCAGSIRWGEIDATFGIQAGDGAMFFSRHTDILGPWLPNVAFNSAEIVHRGSTHALLSNHSLLTHASDPYHVSFSSRLLVSPGLHDDDEAPLFASAYGFTTCTFEVLTAVRGTLAGTSYATIPYYTANSIRLSRDGLHLFDWLNQGDPGQPMILAEAIDLQPGSYTLYVGNIASAFSGVPPSPRAEATLNFDIVFVPDPGITALALTGLVGSVRRRR
ncbi:hypothetical protein PHYC_00799 [Phycisphaerales bacterium]|nr:hypothetical protein PHYC_00799 [Phycisphaerales bacterium]